MAKKGEPLSEEHRRKLSEAHKGSFSGALVHGKRSKLMEELQPVGCRDCDIRNCPYRVETGNSICSMQERWMALGTLLGDVYERDDLANYMAAVLKIQSFRFSKAAFQEALEGMGLDPEITKLGKEIVQGTSKLAELMGHIRGGAHVVIDQRQVHVHQELQREFQDMPENEYGEFLKAFNLLREANENVAKRLLAGETIDDIIDEQLQKEREPVGAAKED